MQLDSDTLRRNESNSLAGDGSNHLTEPVHVVVRWWDGYMEHYDATEVRFGCDLLWMRLVSGDNRHVPLRHVRWFSTTPESHATSQGV